MKPFIDRSKFRTSRALQTTAPSFVPNKNGYGVEIKNTTDLFRRSNLFFISSGKWADAVDSGLIDQEVSPLVIGQSIDILDFSPYNDQNEKKSAPSVLESGYVIIGQTIDYEGETSKDGRIMVFNSSARSYVFKEEIPFQARGIKVRNETILGYSQGEYYNPFLDGGGTDLSSPWLGFYGQEPQIRLVFEDKIDVNGLGIQIDTEDYDSDYQTGAFGTPLYSAEFGTDSIAYAGLKK